MIELPVGQILERDNGTQVIVTKPAMIPVNKSDRKTGYQLIAWDAKKKHIPLEAKEEYLFPEEIFKRFAYIQGRIDGEPTREK